MKITGSQAEAGSTPALYAMTMRLDFIDYPTGWELQAELGTDSPPHDPDCSAVTTQGAMLCDCDAIVALWVEHGGNRERYRSGEDLPADVTPAAE